LQSPKSGQTAPDRPALPSAFFARAFLFDSLISRSIGQPFSDDTKQQFVGPVNITFSLDKVVLIRDDWLVGVRAVLTSIRQVGMEVAMFARHFSQIFACTVPPGVAVGAILLFVDSRASWYVKAVFVFLPVLFFALGWLLNPYLIEIFNSSEVDGLRRRIATLCLHNILGRRGMLNGVENLGKKDDLVFVRAVRPFKRLSK
jgi:hypothetical protein